jgi:diguanylate cyclase (GGDEF)-like protein/PAS domain S-box-containing protein
MVALLRTKQIAWAFSLFLATLALVFSYVSGKNYLNAVGWVEHTMKVSSALDGVLSSIRAQESAARGYLVTGDPVFLDNMGVERAAFDREMSAVRELVRDNREQTVRLARIEKLANEKFSFIQHSIDVRERGDAAQAAAMVASRRGKIMMDRIAELIAAMDSDEARLLAERSALAKRSQHQTVVAIAVGAVVLLVLVVTSLLVMRKDAEELSSAAEELAESEERYRVLIENARELVRLHGADGHPFFVSQSSKALLGYTPEECVQTAPFALVHPDDVGLARYSLNRFQMRELKNGTVTYRLRRRDGEYRWFEFSFSRVDAPDGTLRHYQSSGRDVTLRRQLEQKLAEQTEELRNLSLRDGLTGLYNRRGFLELSAQLVRVAERERHGLALLFADLDGLKAINDGLGHDRGDSAIVEAGSVLRSTCRATDLVARLGGDEFVVLAAKVDGEDSVEILKERIQQAIQQANSKPGREYRLAFSLGVARFNPGSPVAIEALITEADARMYEAKQARRQSARAAERVGLA